VEAAALTDFQTLELAPASTLCRTDCYEAASNIEYRRPGMPVVVSAHGNLRQGKVGEAVAPYALSECGSIMSTGAAIYGNEKEIGESSRKYQQRSSKAGGCFYHKQTLEILSITKKTFRKAW